MKKTEPCVSKVVEQPGIQTLTVKIIDVTFLENCLAVFTKAKHTHVLYTYQICRWMFFKNDCVHVLRILIIALYIIAKNCPNIHQQ